MERAPAEAPLQVYTSDLLLLLCTFVSLTFRACRQGLSHTVTSSPGDSSARGDAITTGPAAVTLLRDDALDVDDNERAHLSSVRPSSPMTETPAVITLPANAEDDDDLGSDADAAASTSIAAADPLRILAERLTLEEKLSTSVNWLSLVSNCLTYFLRPSQVLYAFLFVNGDFVLFVTSYSNRYQRLYAPTTTHPCSAARSLNNDAPLPTRRTRQRSPLPLRGGGGARRLLAHHSGDVTKEEVETVATVAVPPPFLPPLTAGLQIGSRPRDGLLQHGHRRKTVGSDSVSDAYIAPSSRTPDPHYARRLFLASRPLLALRSCVSRCVAFGQTQLSWLLILNALLTSTLFLFHLHHLFFFLGTLAGYLAAVASLFLCGMEVGSIVVRLQRKYLNDEDDDDDGDVQELHISAQDSAEGADRDILGGVNDPHWAFVGEHLSVAACSVLYVWMLLEEGDALWSSHIDLMRWYVCSCALMTLSLMKCLRAVF